MYAIIKTGAQQVRVEEGNKIQVDLLPDAVGSEIQLDKVLLLGGETLSVGKPYVEGAYVKAEVLEHFRGEKIIVFKHWRRNDSRVTNGHRQKYTMLKIKSITA
ncbi:MAG: 50S ribosomal protein L21 [Deltaproteobacteria bacterium]|jgi:large subunit ribosomal protein L21|nr:50S ribosomal protein L21 [Deltaproteobacteria bacterium]